jgi:hypothetical protein
MVFVIWQHLNLPAPTPLQYDIADYLQKGPRRRIIEAFRGIGKSWLTAAYVLWLLYRDPNERILVVSASKSRADAFSTFVKRLIDEMPLLHHLRPREGQRDSIIAFDVGPADAHQAPSMRSVGVTGQMTGGRATRIIADDTEIPSNSMTQAQRDKLAETVKEFDAVLVPGGEITFLGTPQTEMSLYNVLTERGYELRIWPARFPGDKLMASYGNHIAPYIAKQLAKSPKLATDCSGRGAPTEPSRFHDLDLFEREASYGRSGFAMQFMLDTSLSDENKYPLKLADLMVLDLNPEMAPVKLVWASGPDQLLKDVQAVGLQGDRLYRPLFVSGEFAEYQGCVMAIDPSGRGGDETSYAVVAMLNGFLYLLAGGGLRGGYSDDVLQALADTAKKYSVKQVIVESNFGDGLFTKVLTPFMVRTYPCTLEEIRSSQQKEKRIIDTLEPVLNQHRLVVDTKLIKRDQENYNEYPLESWTNYQLFYQLTRVTKERGALAKDDRLDALAMAVAYWVEQMDKDTQKVLDDHRSEMLRLELQKFSDHVLGMVPAEDNWADNW